MSKTSWIPNWAKAALILGFGFSVPVFLGISIDPIDYAFMIGKTVSDSTNPSTSWVWDWSATFYTIYGIVAAGYFILTLIMKGLFTGIAGMTFFFGGFLLVPYPFGGIMLFLLGLIPCAVGYYRQEAGFD